MPAQAKHSQGKNYNQLIFFKSLGLIAAIFYISERAVIHGAANRTNRGRPLYSEKDETTNAGGFVAGRNTVTLTRFSTLDG